MLVLKETEDYMALEPCSSCKHCYIEDIWNEYCCDEKECAHKEEYDLIAKIEAMRVYTGTMQGEEKDTYTKVNEMLSNCEWILEDYIEKIVKREDAKNVSGNGST